MIKSDFGVVTVKGNTPLLMAEFSSLIFSLINKNVFSKEEIKELVEDGMKTEDEIKKEFNEKHKDGISTSEMQGYARAVVEARKSGLVEEQKNSVEPNIKTILDNDNFKINVLKIDTKGKNQDEIENEIANTFKKLFEEEEFDDE